MVKKKIPKKKKSKGSKSRGGGVMPSVAGHNQFGPSHYTSSVQLGRELAYKQKRAEYNKHVNDSEYRHNNARNIGTVSNAVTKGVGNALGNGVVGKLARAASTAYGVALDYDLNKQAAKDTHRSRELENELQNY